jgi:hypothetical protein
VYVQQILWRLHIRFSQRNTIINSLCIYQLHMSRSAIPNIESVAMERQKWVFLCLYCFSATTIAINNTNVLRSSCSVRNFCLILTTFGFSRQILLNVSSIIFDAIRAAEVQFIHAHRQKGGQIRRRYRRFS